MSDQSTDDSEAKPRDGFPDLSQGPLSSSKPAPLKLQSHPMRTPLRISRGRTIPHGMLSPGVDGFRTPTGEDYMNHDNGSVLESNGQDRAAGDSQASNVPFAALSPLGRFSHAFHEGLERLEHRMTERLHWKRRIKHVTWTFFTLNMASGGIANVLANVPFQFNGLYEIGLVVMFFNIALFLLNVVAMTLRFNWHTKTFKSSFMHPTESLFVPAAVVAVGTILINIAQYGLGHVGYWLNTTITALFWVYVGLAMVFSFGIYLVMWSTQTFTIESMTPIWIFPVYPLLVAGPLSGVLVQHLEPSRAYKIMIGGFVAQGIGFMVALTIYSCFIYRLMTQKLPREATRPGLFVSVGPSGFTSVTLINLALSAPRVIPSEHLGGDGVLAGEILRVIGAWSSLWLWGFAIWFFFVSLGAHFSVLPLFSRKGEVHYVPFAMTWFSYIFPNTALVTSTFAVAKAFDIYPLQIIGCVMTILLVIVWLGVLMMMVRAIWRHDILYPQKGEDKDEGGFKAEHDEPSVTRVTATGTNALGINQLGNATQLIRERGLNQRPDDG